MEFKYFFSINCLFVGLRIFCVKKKTFLGEERVFCHNKEICFLSYRDHYLNEILRAGHSCGTVYCTRSF